MNRFVVVIPYFGAFRKSTELFFESCKRNPNIDWLIFTDQEHSEEAKANNIRFFQCSLESIKELAEKKCNAKIAMDRPYKLCDLKPFYGRIFEDYIEGYEFWGYGDMDVIYGRVSYFLERILREHYDKINMMGHLCFIRNTRQCCDVAFLEVPNTSSAEQVFSSEVNLGFDERDFNKKFIFAGLRIYDGIWAADIDMFYWRMRCVDRMTFHALLDTKEVKYAPENYPYQIFSVIDGRVYRLYLKKHKVERDEFAYIHFRKEVPIQFSNIEANTFFITRDGFELVDVEQADFTDYQWVRKMIEKYNNQEGPIREFCTFLVQYGRKVSGKRGW